jgi:DNA-binding NarL/FixJ family response regulator
MHPSSVSPAQGPRILLVEDSALLRELLTEELTEIEGATVVGAADNAPEAIRRFAELQPDLVVLDLALAEGSGFDVLQALRERPSSSAIVVYSGHDAEPYRKRALASGANAFVSKARDRHELVTVIRSVGAAPRASMS